MNNQILKIIKEINGSLLAIGLNEETFLDAIEENQNINICYLLNNTNPSSKKFNITKHGKSKKVNIKKIKKQFKKKSLNNIICDFDIIKQFYRSFIPNSIYMCNNIIYIYGNQKDLETLKNKYQRYTKEISITKTEDICIMKINAQKAKNHLLKDLIYKTKDFASDFIDLITDILIN